MTTTALAKIEETETKNQIAIEWAGSLSDQMNAAKVQFELAFGCYKKTAEHVWLMGQALTNAKELHKTLKKKLGASQPNWEIVLKNYGITVPSDNRARRLYKGFPTIKELQDQTIMEAYKAVGITNSPKKKPTTEGEATKSDVLNNQTSLIPINSLSDNAHENADDEWPDIKQSDLTDPDDDDFDDDLESDDEHDTEPHGTESDLSDEEEDSKDFLDDLDSLVAKAESIQTSKITDDHIHEAFNRIDQIVKRLYEMNHELIARLKSEFLLERQSCGVVPSTV